MVVMISGPLISIVIPVYNEAKGIKALVHRLNEVFVKLPKYQFEVVLVNDGSKDESLALLKEVSSQDQYFYVDLSRNFGKEIALSAGVRYAKGQAVITMDSDLQHPPEYIAGFISLWEKGFEVVTSVRETTAKKSLFRRFGAKIFYSIITRTSDVQMVSNTTDFRLMDRKVVDYFLKVGEKQRMFRGVVDWLGFKTAWLPFKAAKREFGDATYSYSKLFGLAVDSIVSFSSAPLRAVVFLGAGICFVSSLLLLWMLFSYYLDPRFYYTPLAMFVVGNTLLTGIVLLALGVIALYVGKIYGEVLQRPLFVVRESSYEESEEKI